MRKFIILTISLLLLSCTSKKEKANKRKIQVLAEYERTRDYKNAFESQYNKLKDSKDTNDHRKADSLLNLVNSDLKKLQNQIDSLSKIANE
jgi:transcription termination factor NusB